LFSRSRGGERPGRELEFKSQEEKIEFWGEGGGGGGKEKQVTLLGGVE